jgi:hypothetical protein
VEPVKDAVIDTLIPPCYTRAASSYGIVSLEKTTLVVDERLPGRDP